MKISLILLNILSLLIILVWALFKAHISDRFINRFSFIFIAGATTVIIIMSHFDQAENQQFYANYDWERLFFVLAIAARAITEFYCEYGSIKWKDAFTNGKNKLLHITRSNRI
jgi:putative ribosome biogenesis GTPase RsgA